MYYVKKIDHVLDVFSHIYKHGGINDVTREMLSFMYRHLIRTKLSACKDCVVLYNGVQVECKCTCIDNIINWGGHNSYERALIFSIRQYVAEPQKIVIVGGGKGVSAVVAANESRGGSVVVFEGSSRFCNVIHNTISLNNVDDSVRVINNVIGLDASGVRGEGANYIPAEQLPECDTLILDCEGSEVNILEKLSAPYPDKIIVESHGSDGSHVTIERLLRLHGYRRLSKVPAHGFTSRSRQYVLTFCIN